MTVRRPGGCADLTEALIVVRFTALTALRENRSRIRIGLEPDRVKTFHLLGSPGPLTRSFRLGNSRADHCFAAIRRGHFAALQIAFLKD